jgi:hypothetical protein
MNAKHVVLIGAGLLGIFALMPPAHSQESAAQNGGPVTITRFFTGPDGLTHAEEIEVKFAPGGGAYNLLASSGVQLRRTPPGREIDYHPASRRQYVITLSGHAEFVLSGGTNASGWTWQHRIGGRHHRQGSHHQNSWDRRSRGYPHPDFRPIADRASTFAHCAPGPGWR